MSEVLWYHQFWFLY